MVATFGGDAWRRHSQYVRCEHMWSLLEGPFGRRLPAEPQRIGTVEVESLWGTGPRVYCRLAEFLGGGGCEVRRGLVLAFSRPGTAPAQISGGQNLCRGWAAQILTPPNLCRGRPGARKCKSKSPRNLPAASANKFGRSTDRSPRRAQENSLFHLSLIHI